MKFNDIAGIVFIILGITLFPNSTIEKYCFLVAGLLLIFIPKISKSKKENSTDGV